MRTVQRIGIGCLYTLLGLTLAWFAFTVIARLVEPTKYPMLFGYSQAGIVSGSMEPTMSQGDRVVFRRQDSYQLNDVVVYYDEVDGVFVVHRIVGKNGDNFIVQGDYNPQCDPNPVKPEQIQGKVVFAIENLQPFLYIGFGSLATVFIQLLLKDLKRRNTIDAEGGGEQKDEEQDNKTI